MLIEEYLERGSLGMDFDIYYGETPYTKVVTFGTDSYVVEVTLTSIVVDKKYIYDRRGSNIINQIKNAILEHQNLSINGDELALLNSWDGRVI